MEFSCSAMIVRSRGSASIVMDIQHLDILLISSIAYGCVAADCSISGQELYKLPVGVQTVTVIEPLCTKLALARRFL